MLGIYVLKFDYNFHLIQRADDGPVDMRIDYTNLEEYWKDVTNTPSNKKRSIDDNLSFHEWKSRVDRAKLSAKDGPVEVHNGKIPYQPNGSSKQVVDETEPSSLQRRGWWSFVDWISKMTTVTKSDAGSLPMGLTKFFTLYSGRLSCTSDIGVTFTAGMDITADMQMQMQTRYSYYFSGTVVPPHIIDTYAYVSTQPKVSAGITLTGDANLYYQTDPKKIIDTITYPGLAIKGIAAVGPSLDIVSIFQIFSDYCH
jgi:hypothetical protein